MSRPEPTRAAVRDFYDGFLESRMLEYRVRGNLRIERALERVLPLVTANARMLEIGCGIGVVVERLARAAPQGHVWGCDLSERNVAYARRTVAAVNADFFVADVVADFAAIERAVGGLVDVVLLVDVIEHLPRATHAELLRGLARLLAPHGAVVLTYPSPEYQHWLREHDPAELQPVDEAIEPEEVIAAAAAAGLALTHFSLEDVWLTNQYTHCVLRKGLQVEAMRSPPPGLKARLFAPLARLYRDRIREPRLRRRYIDDVFGGGES